jgi:hypothetical protein
MDLSPWDPTPFATVDVAEILSNAPLTTPITPDVWLTLAEPIVKPILPASLAFPTLTAEPSMEEMSLANLDALLLLVSADPARSTPTALLALLTAEAMEVASLVVVPVNNAAIETVVKSRTNLTAIVSPTSVCPSVPLMTIVLMTASLTATGTEVAASNVPLPLIALS